MVSITFRFIIPLTWCHRRSVTSSWNLSTNVSWSSSTFWGLPRYQLNSWWEITSLPSMIGVIIDHFIVFHSTQTCSGFELYLEILATQQFYFFTLGVLPSFMSRKSWEFHHLLRDLDTGDTSCHICSVLGPRVVSNRKTDNWTMMCDFKTSSNPIALKLMVDNSFLDHWLSNHHSNIDHAT